MSIPDFQTLMKPVLEIFKDQKEHHVSEVREKISKDFDLTEEDMNQLLPSGASKVFNNRVAWSIAHLKMSELLESNKRSYYQITQSGLDLLKKGLARIDLGVLRTIPAYIEKKENWGKNDTIEQNDTHDQSEKTPDELIEEGYERIKFEISNEILSIVKSCSPQFFERLVLDVLIKLGYGGSNSNQAQLLGKSGDDGVDGVINEDKLGLDVIYIQAKRWEGQVGQPEIQKFAGALQGQRAKKGIFITTSNFSKPALEYVEKIDNRIILIDGKRLSELMIENNVGVSVKKVYSLKRIDTDYFVEEE
jgi:restriction system protein